MSFADADEVARVAATEADSADALAEYVFRESGLNLDALAAAAERIVDQASDGDDDEFNPEAPFGLRRLNPLLDEDGVLTPEVQQNLRDLLSQFNEEQMDALAQALDAYNLAHVGEDSDDTDSIWGRTCTVTIPGVSTSTPVTASRTSPSTTRKTIPAATR
ncbi:MAG: hypothetical protein U1U88_002187 [Lawsonella clevelandensis]